MRVESRSAVAVTHSTRYKVAQYEMGLALGSREASIAEPAPSLERSSSTSNASGEVRGV